MSNSNISALTSATTPLAGTEVLPVVQSSTTNQVSVANLTAGRTVNAANLNLGVGGSANYATHIVFNGTDYAANGSYNQCFRNGSPVWLTGDYQSAFGTGSGYVTYVYGAIPTVWYNNAVGEQMRLNGVDLKLTQGNLVQGAAGKGINFTANTPAAGMTSQLLNWYEEGTWTPSQGGGLTVIGAFSSTGKYTRVGRQIVVSGTVTGATSVALTVAGIITTNLPFTVGTAGHGNATNAAVNASAAVICTSTNVTSAGAIASTGTITFSATYFV